MWWVFFLINLCYQALWSALDFNESFKNRSLFWQFDCDALSQISYHFENDIWVCLCFCMTGSCHYSFKLISAGNGYAGSSNRDETWGTSIQIQMLFPRVKEEVTVVMRAWTIRGESCIAAQRGVERFAYRLLKAGCGILGQFKKTLCFKIKV